MDRKEHYRRMWSARGHAKICVIGEAVEVYSASLIPLSSNSASKYLARPAYPPPAIVTYQNKNNHHRVRLNSAGTGRDGRPHLKRSRCATQLTWPTRQRGKWVWLNPSGLRAAVRSTHTETSAEKLIFLFVWSNYDCKRGTASDLPSIFAKMTTWAPNEFGYDSYTPDTSAALQPKGDRPPNTSRGRIKKTE